jgi:Fur family ferric uptake transcriptional regulator
LVCLECGRVIEVISPEIEGLQETLARRHEFVPTSHKMQIFGVCRACERDTNIKRNKE